MADEQYDPDDPVFEETSPDEADARAEEPEARGPQDVPAGKPLAIIESEEPELEMEPVSEEDDR